MDEAAALADRVGIVDSGRLLALDTPAALVRGLATGASLQVTVEPAAEFGVAGLLDRLGTLAGVQRCEQVGAEGGVHTIRLSLTGEAAAMVAPVAAEVAAAGRLIGMEIGEASLEDVFIDLTGRSLR
jgi:ABC-2 type transport system ATP-binding protein